MFTGIVEETGRVAAIEPQGNAIQLRIDAETVLRDAAPGDSICVNGVCLTVAERTESAWVADVMKVTLDYTTLGSLQIGDTVNLERAMAAGGRFGGHVVQGHVDGTAQLLTRTPSQHWEVYRFRLDRPEDLDRYLVKKGSITINGTSLTIAEISAGEWFEVSLIPTTMRDTMLGQLHPGDRVNVECDVLAKYVEKMIGPRTPEATQGGGAGRAQATDE